LKQLNKEWKRGTFNLIVTLLIPASIWAQVDQVKIAGRVLDQDHDPLGYTTIILTLAIDSSFVSGAVSDLNGNFLLEGIQPGRNNIEISFIGFHPHMDDVYVGKLSPYLDMGNIVLSADHGLLDEVVVEGQRATVSEAMEKKTYSIDNNVSQSGGSILDAMRNLPGVTIDQEGKVILRGSDKVTVLVDGQQSAITGFGNQQGLANIPASNIDRIEIIHNPSARFSASGMAGIINIIYKKDQKSGLTGELGLTVGVGAITKRKDDLPTDLGSFSANPKVIPNLNVNYTGKNLNYFLQTSIIFQESLPNNEFTTRFYDDGRVLESQVAENRKQSHYFIKGGVTGKYQKGI
jgi:hypothetical protein